MRKVGRKMNKQLIFEKTNNIYYKKKGYDKVMLSSKTICDINTQKLTKMIINLGKDLFDTIKIDMSKLTFNHLQIDDNLTNAIVTYDINNKYFICNLIENWYKENIVPFRNNEMLDIYRFCSICIRLFLINKTIDFVINKTNHDYIKYNIDDKNKFNRNKYFYIFNDYYIEDLDENDLVVFNIDTSNINYNIKYGKLREYATRLYNDMQKTYNISQISTGIYFDREKKKNYMYRYHLTPLSAVFNYIGERICKDNKDITQCWQCGYYMEVDNRNTHYHDECSWEHDKERKKNGSN